MRQVLRKRLLRELACNFLRYAALALLIAMGMYVVVSVVGAADTIIAVSTGYAEKNGVEDGQFHVAVPLTRAQEQTLTDTGIALEKMFCMDLEADDGSVVRLMKNRERINRVELDEGRPAKNDGELVLEKRYCEEQGLNIGDAVKIAEVEFCVVGVGSTPDYELPVRTSSDMAAKSSRFGTGFVTEKQYEKIREQPAFRSEDYCYAYRLGGSDKTHEDVKQAIRGLDGGQSKSLLSFVKKEDNPRILAAAGDVQINRQAGLFAGVIVMVLFTYVISVFVVHQIQREGSVIGTLYALGTARRDLLFHYMTLPVVLTLFGGAAGALAGFSGVGIPVQMAETYSYFSLPGPDVQYPLYLIFYSAVMPPLVAAVVNFLVIQKELSRTALSLIRGEGSARCTGIGNLGNMKFVRRFQLRQMMREKRAAAVVVCGMFLSFLVLMLGLNCYVLCRNVERDSIAGARFAYMYSLKYPPEQSLEGGEACYVEALSKTARGYRVNVSVVGIDGISRYYDAVPVKGKNSIVIGKSVREKYGLKVGDRFTLTDNREERELSFTVKGISDDAGSLAVFMDIGSMRELFGQREDYYNVLLSDRALAVGPERLCSVTSDADVKYSAAVFTSLMMPLVILMSAAAAVMFFVVLYLMLGVMIERAAFGISLVQIFGFRAGEIRKLYLNGNAWVVAAGTVFGIPLAKAVVDAAYPWMVANVACGMDLEFPWYLYGAVFAGVMAAYALINALLVQKLKRITPEQVLKRRE